MSNTNKKSTNTAIPTIPTNQNSRNSALDSEANMDVRGLILRLKRDISDMKKEINENVKVTDQKLDRMGTKIDENVKIVVELSGKMNELVVKNMELTKMVQELKGKSINLEETVRKTQNDNRGGGRELGNIKKRDY